MTQNALGKKLQLKPDQRAASINVPFDYVEQLGLGVDTQLTSKPDMSVDFLQLFVKGAQELEEFIPAVTRVLKCDALLWASYPKGSSKVKTDLHRDILWKTMGKFGLVGVSMVSIDNVWSAMRFRPSEKVGK
jgi:hypothetical protein